MRRDVSYAACANFPPIKVPRAAASGPDKYGVAALPLEPSQLPSGGRTSVGDSLVKQAVDASLAEQNDTEIGMMMLRQPLRHRRFGSSWRVT
jgi:hypothetical protein